MNERLELTDELLVRALRQRTDVVLPGALLSRVMAGATGMRQERATRPWPGLPGWTGPAAVPLPAVAGAAIAVAILVGVVGLRQVFDGPGSSPTPAPTSTTVPRSPAPSPVAPTPAVVVPTPEARLLGTYAALRLRLGNDVAPIDVIGAFDSVWIADIHANDVRRFDPVTMAEIARIPVPGGPAWFVEADGALWVSTQLGTGLSRIDPATNTVVARVGDAPPCGQPFVVAGEIWQAACDGDAFLRIDPVTNRVVRAYAAGGHGFLVRVGDGFVTSGPDGIAGWDPETGAFRELPEYVGPSEAVAASDGETLWVLGASAVLRIDPVDGNTIASLPYLGVVAITFDRGRAYLTQGGLGVVVVDLATTQVVETIPMLDPWVARMAADWLWVTGFNNSDLWRIEP